MLRSRLSALLTLLVAAAIWAGSGGCSGDAQSRSQSSEPLRAESAHTGQPATPEEAPSSTRSDKAMPDFVLQDLDGGLVRLSDFSGKAVLINFWATWCGPCRHEMPDLVRIQNQFGGEGFSVIAISLDQTGTAGVRQFVEKYDLNFPVVMGNQNVVVQFGNFRGIPASFLLNDRHELVKRYTGMVTQRQLERDLGHILPSPA